MIKQRIAVETLALSEVSDLFQESLDISFPKFRGAIKHKEKGIRKAKISDYKWVKTYEEFKGAKLNFYCQFLLTLSAPLVGIGMTHRTTKGLILITFDTSIGGNLINTNSRTVASKKWMRIYTGHFCERYAERIMKSKNPTFQEGSDGIMFSDLVEPVRITDKIAEKMDEIEFQFKDGQAYGYRDSGRKIVYLKTVYSNDMLKGERIDFRDDWKDTLSRLHELFKLDRS